MRTKFIIWIFLLFSCSNHESGRNVSNSTTKQLDTQEILSTVYNNKDSLNLSGKHLENIKEISLPKDLIYLDLSSNKLHTLRLDIKGLKFLDISDNLLDTLVLINTDSLQHLDCSNNNLDIIKLEDHNLNYLNISNNERLKGLFGFYLDRIPSDSLLYDNIGTNKRPVGLEVTNYSPYWREDDKKSDR